MKSIQKPIFVASLLLALTGCPDESTQRELVELRVAPAVATIPRGKSVNLVVTAVYSDGSTEDQSGASSFTSASPTTAEFTTSDPSELVGLARGKTTATVTFKTHQTEIDVEVISATLSALTLSPSVASVSAGAQQQFNAKATFSDGSTADVTDSADWSSNNESIATISNTAINRGQVTVAAQAAVNATATISTTWQEISAAAMLTVGCPTTNGTSAFSGGSGTQSNPYRICSAADLAQLSTLTSAWSQGHSFIQIRDIDMTGTAMNPIGTVANRFRGSYDGAGFVIDHLTLQKPSGDQVGLFGMTNQTTLRRVRIKNASISGRQEVGGLVGSAFTQTTIEDCSFSGTLAAQGSLGGMAGAMWESSLSRTSSHGSATVSSSVAGGLVGDTGPSITITDSYSDISLSSGQNGARLGGLVGYIRSQADISVVRSYVSGAVQTTSKSGALAGETAGGSLIATASYWNGATTGQSLPISGVTNIPGFSSLTSDQMRTQSSFTGWDFVNVWRFLDGQSFPSLR